MPWVRIDENALDHPKIGGLPADAFRLWVQGLAYCQKFLTDGHVSDLAVKSLRSFSPKRKALLVSAGLWDVSETGIQVHDFLDWNESREHVMFARECAKRRVALLREPDLRARIRERDGDICRYCLRTVHWKDRKGDLGGTYDHIDPLVGNTFENLVVCCRGCNSSKGRRTPEQAGKVLHSPQGSKSGSRSDLNQINPSTSGVVCSSSVVGFPDRARASTAETDLATRAGAFIERYQALHIRLRKARYVGKPHFDFSEALTLVGVYDDDRLDKLAFVWLNTDHAFAESGTRTLAKFRSMVSWCEEQLIEWEAANGPLEVAS